MTLDKQNKESSSFSSTDNYSTIGISRTRTESVSIKFNYSCLLKINKQYNFFLIKKKSHSPINFDKPTITIVTII